MLAQIVSILTRIEEKIRPDEELPQHGNILKFDLKGIARQVQKMELPKDDPTITCQSFITVNCSVVNYDHSTVIDKSQSVGDIMADEVTGINAHSRKAVEINSCCNNTEISDSRPNAPKLPPQIAGHGVITEKGGEHDPI